MKPHSAAPDDLGMRCLSVSRKKDARLNLVKGNWLSGLNALSKTAALYISKALISCQTIFEVPSLSF